VVTSASAGVSPAPSREAEPSWPNVELAGRAHQVEKALSIGGDRFSPQAVAAAEAALERARQRVGLGAEATVVAFAGATGSGKSSLFNALAQMDISTVAARRPTTNAPQACVWGVDVADPLLDWLGVAPRDRTKRESVLDADREVGLAGLVLLDLPDHDSAVLSHHLEVDRLIDLVDLLIWVVDPQKYADDSVHSGYLRSLAGRQDTLLIVLNQVDRLDEEAVGTCRHDLRRLLDADGLESVKILATSVSRGDGIAGLRSCVAEAVHGRRDVSERVRGDLDDALKVLRTDLGDRRLPPVPRQATGDLVRALGEASGIPVLLDAVVADYRRRMACWLSCPFPWLRGLLRSSLSRGTETQDTGESPNSAVGGSLSTAGSSQRSRIEIALRDLVDGLGKNLPIRWAEDLQVSARAGGEDLPEALDSALAGVDLVDRRPRWQRVYGAVGSTVASVTIIGFLWLVWLGINRWALGSSGSAPWPLVLGLAFGGLALGGILVAVALLLAALAARRRRETLEEDFDALIAEVVQDTTLSPVLAVLDDFQQVREIVDAPIGGSSG
jgi:GTP-binding protein EngB required for normal cell division